MAPDLTLYTNNFDCGTDGVVITTGNSGGSCGDAFNSVSGFDSAASGIPKFSTTHSHSGGLSAYIKTLGVLGNYSSVNWTLTAWTKLYAEVYIYNGAAFPWSKSNPLVASKTTDADAGTAEWTVRIDTAGTLTLLHRTTVIGTTTNAINVGSWTKIQVDGDSSGVNGSGELRLWLSADAGSPDETISGSSGQTSNSMARVSYGQTGLIVPNSGRPDFYIDDIKASDAALPSEADPLSLDLTAHYRTPLETVVSQ